MFLPPEQRQPGPPPRDSQPPRRELSRREETVLAWLVGFVILTIVVAPLGGSSLLEALWYVIRR